MQYVLPTTHLERDLRLELTGLGRHSTGLVSLDATLTDDKKRVLTTIDASVCEGGKSCRTGRKWPRPHLDCNLNHRDMVTTIQRFSLLIDVPNYL